MSKITLNSISADAFKVRTSEVADGQKKRAEIVGAGRVLAYEHAAKGKRAMMAAMRQNSEEVKSHLNSLQYRELNKRFQQDHLLYAARQACAYIGKASPDTFDEFRRSAGEYFGNAAFFATLQGIYQEVLTPILPAVYSEAVSMWADVVEVGFGETYQLTVGSNDIPIFQDSAWGASRSVPRNRFYAKDYTLNPSPKSAWITAKYMQLIGTGMDFGAFFANIAAGMYAKTMGMWNDAMTAAASNTALVPAGLTFTYNTTNWVIGANKIAAVNNTPATNLFAIGNLVALSKVLPTQVTGAANVNMDAAIATLLGRDYNRAGYIGEHMGVRLLPITDAVVPGTQNGNVTTILSNNDVWMMAGNGYRPMTIAYNRDTPIEIRMDPRESADFEIGINLTIALDSVAVFASKVAHFTV